MTELQVHIIFWLGFCYTQNAGIFLLSSQVRIDVYQYRCPIFFCSIPFLSQDDSCRDVLIQVHSCRFFFSPFSCKLLINKNLCRLLRFVIGTINDNQIIEATVMNYLCTWFDTAYAFHEYMRSHTVKEMLIGVGTLHSKSSKQLEKNSPLNHL